MIETNERKWLQIPSAKVDKIQEAEKMYSAYYGIEVSDSLEASRSTLIQRVRPVIVSLPGNSHVLDIGAGRQILEAEYGEQFCVVVPGKAEYLHPEHVQFHTVDIARLSDEQLLAKKYANVHHRQESATELSFDDNSIAFAMSNLAIDFMPKEALAELFRVLKPGSQAFLNLHYQDTLIPWDIKERIAKLKKKIEYTKAAGEIAKIQTQLKLATAEYFQFLRDEKILYTSKQQIVDTFESYGFVVTRVGLSQGADKKTFISGKWWEVELQKPSEISQA